MARCSAAALSSNRVASVTPTSLALSPGPSAAVVTPVFSALSLCLPLSLSVYVPLSLYRHPARRAMRLVLMKTHEILPCLRPALSSVIFPFPLPLFVPNTYRSAHN